MCRASDCGRKIRDQSEVGHFLDGDTDHDASPALDGVQFGIAYAFGRVVLQAERCEKIAAHQIVLDFRRFREEI
jgi:hypothetical protein